MQAAGTAISRWDVLLAAALFAYALAELLAFDLGGDDAFAGQLAFAAAATLPLVWRRRAPLAVVAVVAAGFGLKGLVYQPTPELLSEALAYLVAIYSVAVATPLRVAAVAGLSALALGELRLLGVDGVDAGENAVNVAFALTGWVVGRLVRRLEGRAVRSEAFAREAVADERARIARELHDIVAHGIGVIVLQARGGRRMLEIDPDAARAAFDTIEESGEQALDEMRRLMEVLRETAEPAGPQPGLDQLPELVQRAAASGVEVRVQTRGQPVRLPPGLELCAFRIVQEAITNCVKHAHAASVDVELEYASDALEVQVRDDGTGAASGPGTGHGLIGMRERVALFHGVLDTGPLEGGGFGVRARFPLAAR